jgi:tRNA nucleotidyltransferase (CCA-adding enzyme)
MQTFLVGGAVRDLMLGMSPKDRDYVVVGATVDEMLGRGFRQVGKDFPVFLHPVTQDEYALARVERKTSAGHTGFTVSTENVTLEDDLSRRDLTINSMAMSLTGELIDPYGGNRDLHLKVLRHTSDAFLEDPLRVLRVARFQARFGPDWGIENKLFLTMLRMVASGDLAQLPFERIWAELKRGLMEPHPGSMVTTLLAIGLLSGPRALKGIRLRPGYMASLASAVREGASLEVRFACTFELDKGEASAKLPREVADVALSVQRAEAGGIRKFDTLAPQQQLALLEGFDILRRSERLVAIVEALQLIEPFDAVGLNDACTGFRALDYQALAAGLAGQAIKQRIEQEKLSVLQSLRPQQVEH